MPEFIRLGVILIRQLGLQESIKFLAVQGKMMLKGKKIMKMENLEEQKANFVCISILLK